MQVCLPITPSTSLPLFTLSICWPEFTMLLPTLINPVPLPIPSIEKHCSSKRMTGDEMLAEPLNSLCQLPVMSWSIYGWNIKCACMCVFKHFFLLMLCCVCACVYAYALWCVVSNEETDGAHSRVWWCRHANTGDSGKDGGTAWVCLFIAYMCLCTSIRNKLALFIRTYRLYICV